MSWDGRHHHEHGSHAITHQRLPIPTHNDDSHITDIDSGEASVQHLHSDELVTTDSVTSAGQNSKDDRHGAEDERRYIHGLVETVEEEDDDYYSDLDEVDPDTDLQQKRLILDQKLKFRFETIFEKYGRDFTGVGDEIDLRTGQIVIDNGHIVEMANEQDAGYHEGGRRMLRALTAEPGAFHESDNPADSDSSVSVEDFLPMLTSNKIKIENSRGVDSGDIRTPSGSMLRQAPQFPDRSSLIPTQAQDIQAKFPTDTSIIAQFGSELGKQIIQHINGHQQSEVEIIEPAWQTPGRATTAHGRRPVLQSLLVQPEEGQRASPPNVSLWAPAGLPRQHKKHALQHRHVREHYRNPQKANTHVEINDESTQRAAKRTRRSASPGQGLHNAYNSRTQVGSALSLAGQTPIRPHHTGLVPGSLKPLNPYRNMFTSVEDEALERRIKETVAMGYNVSHACYMNLHRQFPHHTWAAWKNRYRTKFKSKYPRMDGAAFRKEKHSSALVLPDLSESKGVPSSTHEVRSHPLVESAIHGTGDPSIEWDPLLNDKVSAAGVESPAQDLTNNSINRLTSPHNIRTSTPDLNLSHTHFPRSPGPKGAIMSNLGSLDPEKQGSGPSRMTPAFHVQPTVPGRTTSRNTQQGYLIDDADTSRVQDSTAEARSPPPPLDEVAYSHAVRQFAAKQQIGIPAVREGILATPKPEECTRHRPARTAYCEEDDQFMLEFLACIKPHVKSFRDGRHWGDLEFLNPKHSQGSWRSRWAKHYSTLLLDVSGRKPYTTANLLPLSPQLRPELTLPESISPDPCISTASPMPYGETASLTIKETVLPDDASRKHIGTVADKVLLDFVQQTQSQGLPVWAASSQDLWEEFASRNPVRSARRWKNRYRHILYGSAGNLLFKSNASDFPADSADGIRRPPSHDEPSVQRTSPPPRPPDRTLRNKLPIRRLPGTLSWTDVLNTIGETDPILHASLIADGRSFNDTAYTAPQCGSLCDSVLSNAKTVSATEASSTLATPASLISSSKERSEIRTKHDSRSLLLAKQPTQALPRVTILDPPCISNQSDTGSVHAGHVPRDISLDPCQAATYTSNQVDSANSLLDAEDDRRHDERQFSSMMASVEIPLVSDLPRHPKQPGSAAVREPAPNHINQSIKRKSTGPLNFREDYQDEQTQTKSLQYSKGGLDANTISRSSIRTAPSNSLIRNSVHDGGVTRKNAISLEVASIPTGSVGVDVAQEQSWKSGHRKIKSPWLDINDRSASSSQGSKSATKASPSLRTNASYDEYTSLADQAPATIREPQAYRRSNSSVVVPALPEHLNPEHNGTSTSRITNPATLKQSSASSSSAIEAHAVKPTPTRRVIPSTSDIEVTDDGDDGDNDDMDELSILPTDTPLLRVAQAPPLKSTARAASIRSRLTCRSAVRFGSDTSSTHLDRDEDEEMDNELTRAWKAAERGVGMATAVSMHASAVGLGWGPGSMR